MICGTFTMRGMTSDEADAEVADFKTTNPISVTKKQEADGTYTVTAVYPDCAANTSHVAQAAKAS